MLKVIICMSKNNDVLILELLKQKHFLQPQYIPEPGVRKKCRKKKYRNHQNKSESKAFIVKGNFVYCVSA